MIGKILITGLIGSIEEDGKEIKGVELVDVISQVERQGSASSFDVVINSPGGVEEVGSQIYDYLSSLSRPVRTIARGQCCSIATKIFLSGDKREVMEGCEFMIHNPWVTIEGDAEYLTETSKYLRQVEASLISTYNEVTGLSKEAIAPLMKAETFFTIDQLIELRFATGRYSESIEAPEQPTQLKAVAYTKKLIKNDDKMADEKLTKEDFDKKFGGLEAILNGIKSALKIGQVKALVLQDATGAEINFPDLEEGATPEVGAKATIDGKPAEGSYVMPSLENATVTFAGGAVTEIVPESTGDPEELAALKEQNEALKAENEALKGAQATLNTKVETFEKEVLNLKKSLGSSYNYNPEVDPHKKDDKPKTRSLFKTEK